MKVFLDDERKAPVGWVQVRWPEQVVALIETGKVTEVSLDHDLGDDVHGTGYDVLKWLEEKVFLEGIKAPKIYIHSANGGARLRMEQAVRKIESWNEELTPL